MSVLLKFLIFIVVLILVGWVSFLLVEYMCNGVFC